MIVFRISISHSECHSIMKRWFQKKMYRKDDDYWGIGTSRCEHTNNFMMLHRRNETNSRLQVRKDSKQGMIKIATIFLPFHHSFFIYLHRLVYVSLLGNGVRSHKIEWLWQMSFHDGVLRPYCWLTDWKCAACFHSMPPIPCLAVFLISLLFHDASTSMRLPPTVVCKAHCGTGTSLAMRLICFFLLTITSWCCLSHYYCDIHWRLSKSFLIPPWCHSLPYWRIWCSYCILWCWPIISSILLWLSSSVSGDCHLNHREEPAIQNFFRQQYCRLVMGLRGMDYPQR